MRRDYSLTGPESELAVKKGLASGQWYLPHIERSLLKSMCMVHGHIGICMHGGVISTRESMCTQVDVETFFHPHAYACTLLYT